MRIPLYFVSFRKKTKEVLETSLLADVKAYVENNRGALGLIW
jgi:hypothetical protein